MRIKNYNKTLRYIVLLIIIPLIILGGIALFNDKVYGWISLLVCIFSCIPFYMSFEKRGSGNPKELTVLAVMIVFSIIGRYVFAFVPHFKPVTAVVVITGIYLGAEGGFLCGSLSALLSNFIFGQGIWTPFQMFSWGIIGLFSGVFAKQLKSNKVLLALYGVVAGVLYSLILDVSSIFFMDGYFNIGRYFSILLTGLPVTVIYSISNVIFLLLLTKPIGKKLERLKIKYGM